VERTDDRKKGRGILRHRYNRPVINHIQFGLEQFFETVQDRVARSNFDMRGASQSFLRWDDGHNIVSVPKPAPFSFNEFITMNSRFFFFNFSWALCKFRCPSQGETHEDRPLFLFSPSEEKYVRRAGKLKGEDSAGPCFLIFLFCFGSGQ